MLLVDFLSVLAVEAEKVAQLGSSVNFSLPDVLALAQHGGSHHLVSVFGGQEVGSLQEDSDAVVERQSLPLLAGSQGTLDGLLGQGSIGFVVVADNGLVFRGVQLLGSLASVNLKGQSSSESLIFE